MAERETAEDVRARRRALIAAQFRTCWYCKVDQGSAKAATACELVHEGEREQARATPP